MGLDYLIFGSYWNNLTSPLSCWHRGTTFQFDVTKDHKQMPVVFTDLGTGMVMVTMAARIMQSVISLGKNLQKRASFWKMLPRLCVSKALRAVMWLCWTVIDLLLPFLMTVYVYKNRSTCKTVCDAEQPMNAVSIKCHWGSHTEPVESMIVEELYNLKTEVAQKFAKMEVDCEEVINKKDLLPSCTNPVILSMICMPSEHMDSSEGSEADSSEESEVSGVGGLERDCFQEEMSVDSGMQESWSPLSKYEEDCGEESDWSDDSWDEESDSYNDEDDLWASFCHSDPYNPLSFAMPTRSLEQPKKEAPIKSPETHRILGNLDHTKVAKTDYGVLTKNQNMKCKKPVLSGFKSSHTCALPKEELMEEGDRCTKKVRFSLKVTVHPIITWSFAHRMARRGPWEEYARDRCRFQRRIAETEVAIGFCLDPHHREKIWTRLYDNQS